MVKYSGSPGSTRRITQDRRMPYRNLVTLLVALLFGATAWAQDAPLFKLVAKGGKFEPAVLEVPAGQRFRIEVTNANTKAIEFESKDLKQEKVIPPGGKATVYVSPLKAGEYTFFDEFQQATATGKVVAK
jgi:plastocyanin